VYFVVTSTYFLAIVLIGCKIGFVGPYGRVGLEFLGEWKLLLFSQSYVILILGTELLDIQDDTQRSASVASSFDSRHKGEISFSKASKPVLRYFTTSCPTDTGTSFRWDKTAGT